MKKKLSILLITLFVASCSARAEFDTLPGEDFTGESFFSSPSVNQVEQPKVKKDHHTVPIIKQLRLKLQDRHMRREQADMELAPVSSDNYVGEVETSEFASKDQTEDFEDMSPDGFENDEIKAEEPQKKKLFGRKNKQKSEIQDSIILDCENIDYDTRNYLMYATGNVNVEFVKQKTNVKADIITFDRMNNTLKAEGNVRILKHDKVITGDYIFVDMNEENALIENPITETDIIIAKAQKGYVYGDKITQEKGNIEVVGSYPINYIPAKRAPRTREILVPKDQTLTNDMNSGLIKFTAKDIKITQKGDHEIIAITKGRLYRKEKTIFKIPRVKIYTNKNHDYVESNIWEVGSYRGLGFYTGPGWVFELPKGSTFKAMPILNYKSGLGVGGFGRFQSGTNRTMLGYGTAENRFILYGKQDLDDNLFLQYGVNSYMDEWFLGGRRPKYGVGLTYNKSYNTRDFLIHDHPASFSHRFDIGYYQDMDRDKKFEKTYVGGRIGTSRFRYMASAEQNFLDFVDEEGLKSFSLGWSAQLSAAIYGTGDTQIIGRTGPKLSMQYKRWKQDLTYYYSTYDDNTPMPVFDAYRYGRQILYIREYFRICKGLTISWFGAVKLGSDDSLYNDTFRENCLFFTFGPDDIKFSLGYDVKRQTFRYGVDIMMDAKGTKVEYDTLEIKRDQKAEKKPEKTTASLPRNPAYQAPTAPKVLNKAIVEDIKVMEEVL